MIPVVGTNRTPCFFLFSFIAGKDHKIAGFDRVFYQNEVNVVNLRSI
jgi:hypothetical protein